MRDLTFDTHGHAVTVNRLDEALDGVEGLETYQVEQTERGRYIVRYTPEIGEQSALPERIRECLGDVYGADAGIDIRRETVIAPEQSGKFRLARSALVVHPEELFA